MSEAATSCSAAESLPVRVLKLTCIALLCACGVLLSVLTRPVLEFVTLRTFLQLALFVAAFGILASGVAAFWWQDAALRRVQWAGYLGLVLLIAEQFAAGRNGTQAHSPAAIFGLLVLAIVLARVSRTARTEACHCG